ncbi:MAG: TatD family hydrolase [Thermoplasmatota archaeon]
MSVVATSGAAAGHPAGTPRIPAFDNHFHLDPKGGVELSVSQFVKAGGTGLMVVHKPYGESPRYNRTLEDHRQDFETTLGLADRVRAAFPQLRILVAIAPHPAEFTKMIEAGATIDEADLVYRAALDLAARYVRDGKAVAMGEVGRPHWTPIEPPIWERANQQMEHAFALCRDAGCPAIVHCETGTPEVFRDLAAHAKAAGLAADRVIKHFSPPIVDTGENSGLFPSVLIGKDAAETAIRFGTRFVMETDFMDDPRYPGAVLGPKTVPKRTLALVNAGSMTSDQAWKIHVENPTKLYGHDMAPL